MGRPKTRDGKCSKCKEAPAVNGQAWCTRCSTAYHESRQSTVILQAHAAGFTKGTLAMRQALSDEFKRLGGAKITCDEVGRAISESPLPQFQGS